MEPEPVSKPDIILTKDALFHLSYSGLGPQPGDDPGIIGYKPMGLPINLPRRWS